MRAVALASRRQGLKDKACRTQSRKGVTNGCRVTPTFFQA